jgi:beta-1,4-mannosyl-glycoprotein beta-1,4-N-acetylglucosaminyltransferase
MIYDCFTFYNELDLLEIRLNTLNDVADYFVLVEATKTFTNKDKQLVFDSNKERFNAFQNKIIHVVVDDLPEYKNDPWQYEKFQRNAIMRGLTKCNSDDLILISDVDEIPSPDAILQCKQKDTVYLFRQSLYHFYFNMQYEKLSVWHGTMMAPFKMIKTPEELRLYREYNEHYSKHVGSQIVSNVKKILYLIIFNFKKYRKFKCISYIQSSHFLLVKKGGWHFSYLGGIESIIQKINSYSHQEINTPENNDPKNIYQKIEDGTFDIKMSGDRLKIVEIDNTYPEYFLDNLNKYKEIVYKKTNL